jgi:4-hydroxy-tetrahydrodipicolinate synthase
MDALFVESNPIPLKAALKLLGIGEDVVRLPLMPASAATRTLVAEALCLAADGTLPGVK